MLKRSWSENPRASDAPAKAEPAGGVRDSDAGVALPAPSSALSDATNTHFGTSRAYADKKRKLDASWAPFAKRTTSAPSLDALIRPLSGAAQKSAEPPASGTEEEAPRPRQMSRVFLSLEQQRVLETVVKQGQNVFFTGSAGTGKSVLLRYIISDLKQKYKAKPDAVAVTASTGIAACNVGGTTLHSFGGVGLAKETPERLLSYVRRNRKAVTRWMRTAVLIIDESTWGADTVSMIDPKLFDKLEAVARLIRKSPKPFGGIQIVATGDFFQLPPVTPGSDSQFVFESGKWREVIQQTFNLTQVFRQKDSAFVTMLNEMRYGKMSPETVRAFARLERTPSLPENMTPTELFPLRRDVDRANQSRLDAIESEVRVYTSLDGGSLQGEFRERVLENFLAPRHVHLKKGAQVMLIKNLGESLVNGSIGTVVDFLDESQYEDAYGDEDDVYREEVTSKLLARSDRTRRSASPTKRSASPEKGGGRALPQWPLVRFVVPGGTRDLLVRPETWKNEEPNGEVIASRTQVPLVLAWAMSIHKSQGQTLACCRIDLRRVFEKGQAYVALSRATSLDTLQVIGFEARRVMAHPKVIRWSQAEFAPRD